VFMSRHFLYYCSEPTLDVKIAFCQSCYAAVVTDAFGTILFLSVAQDAGCHLYIGQDQAQNQICLHEPPHSPLEILVHAVTTGSLEDVDV
ncbi:hypothetical protein lerEdw1_002468, partial [Lerista edwardsae]